MNLEIDEVIPVRDPLIEQTAVVGLHQLIAALKFFVDPTRDVLEAFRRHATAVAKPAIHGYGIPEVLHHHVQYAGSRNIKERWLFQTLSRRLRCLAGATPR